MELKTGEGSNPDPVTLIVKPELLMVLRHAGVDLLAYNGAPCSGAVRPLTEAARRIEADPGLRPVLRSVGWEGDIGTGVVEGIRWAAERCADRLAAVPLTVEVCNDLWQRKRPNSAISNSVEALQGRHRFPWTPSRHRRRRNSRLPHQVQRIIGLADRPGVLTGQTVREQAHAALKR